MISRQPGFGKLLINEFVCNTRRGGLFTLFIALAFLANVAPVARAASFRPMAIDQPSSAVIETILKREIARVAGTRTLSVPREALMQMVVSRLATEQSRMVESRGRDATIAVVQKVVHQMVVEQMLRSRQRAPERLGRPHAGARSIVVHASTISVGERTALIDLYNSTNGVEWYDRTNWRNDGDTDFNAPGTECTWVGVTCDDGQTTVQELDLSWNNLAGTLPASLGTLTNLQLLSLYDNQLTNSIPIQLGTLTNLLDLWLDGNQLTGSIPTQLGDLTNLQSLDLSSNQLTGSIPTQFGSLTNLQSLYLDGNQLTGSIPIQFGSLTNLQYLYLDGNQLTGSIPIQFGSLTNLLELNLSWNQLTGSIPTQLGALTNLQYLYLRSNGLTGSIPTQLGNLTNLLELDLWWNQLTGSIPIQLGSLTNLQYLDLSINELTGSIPTQLGSLPELLNLSLDYNHLTGSIPNQLGTLSKLLHLGLSMNQLTGLVPSQLGNLTNLRKLWLNSNQLIGAVPGTLTSLTNLGAGNSDFRWNGLYSSDPSVVTFLNGKQLGGDWQSTQTVPVTGLTAGVATTSSVALTWIPITYTGDTGGYQAFYSKISGGPYTLSGTTASKLSSNWTVTGLEPATPYYFIVKSVSNPHTNNQNTVVSDPSAMVSKSTLVAQTLTVLKNGNGTGVVTSAPIGIACGATCIASFVNNAGVTLAAVASTDSVFSSWSGEGCSGNGTCQVTMDQPRIVTATFDLVSTGFYPITPCRVFDTRDPSGAPIIAGGGHRTFTIIDKCGIPAGAKAITGNVTVVNGSVVGNMSIIAGNLTSTLTTTIEIPLARARANNAVIQLATDGAGTIKVINNTSGTVHLILDVNGYFQ